MQDLSRNEQWLLDVAVSFRPDELARGDIRWPLMEEVDPSVRELIDKSIQYGSEARRKAWSILSKSLNVYDNSVEDWMLRLLAGNDTETLAWFTRYAPAGYWSYLFQNKMIAMRNWPTHKE